VNINTELVDRFYEAAAIPEFWPAICSELCRAVDSYSVILFDVAPDQTHSYVCSPSAEAIMAAFSSSPLRFQNIRPVRALQRSPSSFARDIELMSQEELDVDPVYTHFMRPYGLKYAAGCAIQEPSGHTLVFDVQKEDFKSGFAQDEINTLNGYKPDLARATLLASRLAFQQATTMTSTLSAVGLPAAVIGAAGNVVSMNSEMEDLNSRIRTGAQNRISLGQVESNKLLQDILEQTKLGLIPSVQSIPIAADFENPALVLHLLPVKRNARDIFSRSTTILIATPVGEVGPPDLRVICGLFDLTAGEARVAREVAVGTSIEDIAKKTGLTVQTVRTYLKLIFSKTGTSRQSQLTALLSGLRAPGM